VSVIDKPVIESEDEYSSAAAFNVIAGNRRGVLIVKAVDRSNVPAAIDV
jgi:hypothetical protein